MPTEVLKYVSSLAISSSDLYSFSNTWYPANLNGGLTLLPCLMIAMFWLSFMLLAVLLKFPFNL